MTDEITVKSTCVNIATGEERPFEEARDRFFEYALSVMPVVHTDKPVPLKNAEYCIILNESVQVIKRGSVEFQGLAGRTGGKNLCH